MALKQKPIPVVKDYQNNTKASLSFAYNIDESLVFGDMAELTMKIPYYQYDVHGNVQTDVNDDKIINYNLSEVKNEMLIDFNNKLYIIKNVSPLKTKSNKRFVEIKCEEKSIELSYKNIAFLDMSPPVFNPVKANAGIINLLTSKFEVDSGEPQSITNNTIQLRAGFGGTELTGQKICIIDGTGQGQDRRIISYDSDTNTVTVDADWDTNPTTSSIYRVHYSKWTIGQIETQFLNNGTKDIFRGYEFQDVTITRAISDIAERLDGFITYDYEYSATYNEYINKVNLVSPRQYDNVEMRYKKNLLSLKKQIDTNENSYTRIYPYGRDNLTINDISTRQRIDSGVTYDEHKSGQSYIENYQYYLNLGYSIDFCRENFVNDFEFNNDSYTNISDLYDDAKKVLDKASQPKVTYEVDALDLSVLTGYDYEYFDVGDTIRVVDNELDININATVIQKDINWDNPQNATIELSNFIENLGNYIYRIIKSSNKYTDKNKVFGKASTYIIADKTTSKNWRYADYYTDNDSNRYLNDVLNPLINDMKDKNTSGKIVLLEGTFKVDSTIEFSELDNTVIEGQGDETIIIPTQNNILSISIFDFNNSLNSKIKSLVIDGTYITTDCSGIRLLGANHSDIEDVVIKNTHGAGVYLATSSGCTLTNVTINNIVADSNGDSYGLDISSSSECLFQGVTIEQCNSYGIEESLPCTDNKYINSLITNNNNGMKLDGVGAFVNNCTISQNGIGIRAEGDLINVSNNTIAGNTSAIGAVYAREGANVRYANNSFSANDVAIRIELTESCVLSSNYFLNNTSEAIKMLGTNKIKIQNNTFKDNNETGGEQVIISGDNNTFDGNTVRGMTQYSIDIIGNNNLIVNNDFTDGYSDTAISSGSGDITGQNRT